jgi:hypothetical protein
VHLGKAWKIGMEISPFGIILLHLDQEYGRILIWIMLVPRPLTIRQEALTELQICEPLNVSNGQYAVVA